MRSAAARLLLIPLITATIALTGCTPKTSLERHTRHYVYASDDGFDPNFYTQKADTIRMMLPFFQQFMKHKAAGGSAETRQLRVKEVRAEKFFHSRQSTTTFAGRKYTNSDRPSPKKVKLMADTISAVDLG
ncbi:Exc2 family lipoprotein [Escherichia coli]|uniref:Exc2 family lipoprotein n=1 Tax=Escherichia coli TaxID=562 RepID=UPI0007E4B616|nr:Exc2 family lipoprotein [Escherichia coli]